MPEVQSSDGTRIAYDRRGSGPPVILVDGALCSRSMGPMSGLASRLAATFTVISYDRRGRGESGDTRPYSPRREIEDLVALIGAAGDEVFVVGISSGAALSLDAASGDPRIRRLALFEAPFVVDGSREPISDVWDRVSEAISEGRRGDAVKLFLGSVGVPAIGIVVMRLLPVWRKLEAVAHTLPYDAALVRAHQTGAPLSSSTWGSVTAPALVMDGGRSPAWIRNAMRSLASVLPNARYQTLERQSHNVSPKALAPVLAAFFAES